MILPNWAEGSLKLRGRSENIASALKEMLLNDTVTLEDKWDGALLIFNNTASGLALRVDLGWYDCF